MRAVNPSTPRARSVMLATCLAASCLVASEGVFAQTPRDSDIRGCWRGALEFGFLARVPIVLELTTMGDAVAGTFRGPAGPADAIEHGHRDGVRVSFEVAARRGRMRFDAKQSPCGRECRTMGPCRTLRGREWQSD